MTRRFNTRLHYVVIGAAIAASTAAVADQRVTRFIYNADGELVRSVDAAGLVTDYRYREDGRVFLRSDSVGRVHATEYDARGLQVTRTDQRSDGRVAARTRYRYDLRGFLSEQTSASVSRRIESDAVGNPVAEFDGNANPAQRTSRDFLSRITTITDPAGGNTAYAYDNGSNLRLVTGPTANTTRYRWDDFGNRILETGRDRGAVRYTFDLANNLSRRTDARRVAAQYRYDALDRPLRVDYPGTDHDIAYTWDLCENGRGYLCRVTESKTSTQYAYDAWGNVSASTVRVNGKTFTTRYLYDRENRITRLTYPNGRVVIYLRDAAGRITTVDTIISGRRSRLVVARRYREDGRVVHQRRLGGLRELRSYDEAGQLSTLSVDRAGQTLVDGSFEFDANGNVTGVDLGPSNARYAYDGLNRMVSDQRTGANAGTLEFSYDGAGNRTAIRINGTRRSVQHKAGSNQLTRSHNGALQVDGAGYVRSDRNGSRRFVWDQRGNLATISRSGRTIATYAYDYRNLRVSKTVPGKTPRTYIYDQQGRLLAEYENGRWIRDYVWLDRELLVQNELGVRAGRPVSLKIAQFIVDHLPQPRVIFDQRGVMQATLAATGFGETAAADVVSKNYPIRFPGHYLDEESGLHYNWHRYYDPAEGRYLSSDPLGLFDGLNTFAYAHSRPVVEFDPTGLRTCGAGWNEPLVPDSPLGYRFTDCCESHDTCYGTCDPSLTRAECDGTFCDCMDGECESAHGGSGVCQFLSGIYCKSVSRFGQNFFNIARSTCTECN